MTTDRQRFEAALARIDAANGEDPSCRMFEGREYPYALLYGLRMTHWLAQLEPDAPEVVQLAVRAQHICRWKIPRSEYPLDRTGYHRWRTRLYEFHAETAGRILAEVGYDEATIAEAQNLLRKREIKSNPRTQLLEDVACLVFLENDFSQLAREHEEAKMIDILRKTWRKMSDHGQAAALHLPMAASDRELIE
ncbi:MAG: DUF4202 domain-containing protein, partial [Thermoguttaceae bacterium]